jgi:hypothetical protein
MSMASRFAACVIVASWVLAPPGLWAQPMPGGPAYGPPSGAWLPGEPPPGYGPMMQMHPGGCGCQTCSASGMMGAERLSVYHRQAAGYDDVLDVSPFERYLSKVMRNMWIRLEYLAWDIDDPGEELLGEETLTGDPRVPFDILVPDPVNPNNLIVAGVGSAQDLGRISLLDTDGIRGTIGIPFREFDYEWSWWLLEQNADAVEANIPEDQIPGIAIFSVIPTLVDGQLSDDIFILFDESFKARVTSELWGTDMKWVFPLSPQWPGLRVDPLIEARYMQFRENLTQVGVLSGEGLFTGPFGNEFATVIDAESINHVYGAGVGLSARFVHPWVTVGIEPRVSLALNTYQSELSADVFGDRRDTEDDGTVFSPTLDVQAYFKLHPTPHCTIVGGYNLLILSHVTRPYDSIRYNLITDPQATFPANDISVDPELETVVIHGWTIGAEFTFR